MVEQVAAHLPQGARLGFHRTAAGTELDIVVESGSRRLGIEVRFSALPTVSKGFWLAREDLRLTRALVVAPVERAYLLRDGVDVVPVWQLPALLREFGRTTPLRCPCSP